MGIRNGLAAFEGKQDWRGPVADRLVLPTADGGRCITDAVIEAGHIINAGRALAGMEPWSPKNGARFHFSFPRSVQGFKLHPIPLEAGEVRIENAAADSTRPDRSLAIAFTMQTNPEPIRIGTATFSSLRIREIMVMR